MKVTREKFAQNRQKIIGVAGDLLRNKGFSAIGVAEVMKGAGLTHGGFYRHFESKDNLAYEAVKALFSKTEDMWKTVVKNSPDAPLEALLDHYLSDRNLNEPSGPCVFTTLTQEVSRQGPAMREAFSASLKELAAILEEIVDGTTADERHQHALSTLTGMMGAVTLARATEDPDLAKMLLSAARQKLLQDRRKQPHLQKNIVPDAGALANPV
ncbi:TetR/AcrR family transcriptional repressor of nem operon [Phyllobacterium sp. 1468]|uniref:TetR/AcrR family transcriptional regulator n=1 Tax=Phyllobacterium sp. 1468 TaxID=2817759 RepID=UPI00285B5F29|nr:TetR/AcrR family transcriptional regulator [Phyllobacterium sp. 1468]MDR6632599.1 TetR/AcrR family transcriptional repressor of nem operon [Phyllobacterium sp. 1468]